MKLVAVSSALTAVCVCLWLQEVLDFQVDKQARLNQLPAVVSLRRHQLALLDAADISSGDNAADSFGSAPAAETAAAAGTCAATEAGGSPLPSSLDDTAAASKKLQELDLSEALVFSLHELEKLKHRMQVQT